MGGCRRRWGGSRSEILNHLSPGKSRSGWRGAASGHVGINSVLQTLSSTIGFLSFLCFQPNPSSSSFHSLKLSSTFLIPSPLLKGTDCYFSTSRDGLQLLSQAFPHPKHAFLWLNTHKKDKLSAKKQLPVFLCVKIMPSKGGKTKTKGFGWVSWNNRSDGNKIHVNWYYYSICAVLVKQCTAQNL